VTAVSFANTLGLAGPPSQIEREGDGPPAAAGPLMAPTLAIDDAYFRALGPSLTSGRTFDRGGGRAGQQEVVVNERLAHLLFPDGAAIGRRIRVAPPAQKGDRAPWRTIVGIAPNLRQVPGAAPDPIVYLPFDASLPARPALLIHTADDPAALAPLVREQVRGVDADLPIVALQTARQAERDAGWNARMSQNIIGTIAFIAVVLAGVGLYAVTAYGVAQRRREIGIRIALGAAPSRVMWLVLRGALFQVFLGFAAGVVLKAAWARTFAAQGATSVDPFNFASAVAILAIVAMAASAAPVLRALRVNPISALRCE
jgi:hypothetical protein